MRVIRKSAGRPTKQAAEEISANIPRVAGDLFLERGYAGTTVDDIAARAGVAKHTIYRRFKSKEELFVFSVLSIFRENLVEFEARVHDVHADPAMTLKGICRAELDIVLKPKVLGLYRMAIADTQRFPAMAATLRDDVLEDGVDLIAPLIEAAQRLNRCMPGDPRFLAQFLLLSITGLVFNKALLGAEDLAKRDARDAYFEKAWEIAGRMFLKCGPNTGPTGTIRMR